MELLSQARDFLKHHLSPEDNEAKVHILGAISYLISVYQGELSIKDQGRGAMFNAQAISMWINNLLHNNRDTVSFHSVSPKLVKEVLKMLARNNMFLWEKTNYEEEIRDQESS